ASLSVGGDGGGDRVPQGLLNRIELQTVGARGDTAYAAWRDRWRGDSKHLEWNSQCFVMVLRTCASPWYRTKRQKVGGGFPSPSALSALSHTAGVFFHEAAFGASQ
ncbi:MAG: hypothetical protein ACK5O5_00425, partial [bacterium]